jgi:outer membrane protein assembly factor BamE (lipoprotein component of BamABCDE complex)
MPQNSSRWFHSIVLLTCLAGLTFLAACASKQSQMGVQNKWRAASPPPFQKGRTSQSEVMAALGPPSQVIALHDQTLFYYLREQLQTKAIFLLLYNQTRENVSYDRAIFFFDKNGTLSDFAYSEEAIPLEK